MNRFCTLILILFIFACKKDRPSGSPSNNILNFTVVHANNPAVPDMYGVIKNDTITVTLPNDTVSKIFSPTIVTSDKATVSPASEVKEDFSQPVIYTVKAADGSAQTYVVICKPAVVLPSLAQLNGLKINGADCAFAASTKTYYFPVTNGSQLNNYTVSFDTTTTRSLLLDNNKTVNGAKVTYPLSTNQQVTVQALDKYNKPVNYKLIITGLPIVTLSASQTIADDDVAGDFKLVDPDYATRNSQLEITTKIMISIRGNTARTFPKKAYSVHLVDDQGADADASLLGLRNDNSWILDAMYIDQSRMRNRVCTDIWNSFNNVPYLASEPAALNGTRGYMTEVFLNNEYWGVYCLTERLDRKQLQVKKSYGDMYKADDWSPEVMFKGVSAYSNSSATWGGWELEYPDLGDSPSPDWGYLYNVVNFISSSTDEQFMSDIANKVDINNMVDYFIYYNVLGAFDNQSKNTFFSFYDYRKNSNFFYSVWDMDASLGRYWDGNVVLPNTPLIGAGNNNLYQRLLSLNPGNFKQLVKTRWNALKTNQLSKSAVSSIIERYRKQLVDTHAIDREMAKWANLNQDLNTETTFMDNWYSAQFTEMDNYINGF